MKHNNSTNKFKTVFLIFLIFSSSIISAATIIVTRDDDLGIAGDGGCSLRDAIISATINFGLEDCVAGEVGTMDAILIIVPGPIQLTSQLDITSAMLIYPYFNAPRVTIIAATNSRIFSVHPSTLHDVDLQMGRLKLINGDAGAGNGGAIFFDYPNLTTSHPEISLVDIEFENNYAESGGAIYADNPLVDSFSITQSKFINNNAVISGSAIGIRQIFMPSSDSQPLKINNNLFLSNVVSAPAEDSHFGTVSIGSDDQINIKNNVFLNNTTNGKGGALSIYDTISGNPKAELVNNVFLNNHAEVGGAIYLRDVQTYMINNTFAFNSADIGGGVSTVGSSSIRMYNSTFVYNQAISQGASINSTNAIKFERSIFAYPIGASNCEATPVNMLSWGANISDDTSCDLNLASDIIADPKLSGLVYHDSGLPGFIPTADSPALDTSLTADCLVTNSVIVIEFDQQGNPRITDGDGDGTAYCDSGAIEAPYNTDLVWADSLGG